MELGLIGLGRMGGAMSRRGRRAGHTVVGFARHPETVTGLVADGGLSAGATSLEDLVSRLSEPRTVWLMVPAAAVDATLDELVPLLASGDTVVDGGNSYYRDDLRRSRTLADHGIDCVDVGVSGGVAGLERGYCLMIGGPDAPVQRLDPLFDALAPGAEAAPRTPARSGPPVLEPGDHWHDPIVSPPAGPAVAAGR